eukprot:INCI2659.2.p1 GENE.INCI2659.2~~INCI2659.2.p1  ORF type:complete len:424 (+),score=78.31 INCI2659.2:105-1376(+)
MDIRFVAPAFDTSMTDTSRQNRILDDKIAVKYEFLAEPGLHRANIRRPPQLVELRRKLALSYPAHAALFDPDIIHLGRQPLQLRILYRDPEGDEIVISSDHELEAAVRQYHRAGKVFKFTIPAAATEVETSKSKIVIPETDPKWTKLWDQCDIQQIGMGCTMQAGASHAGATSSGSSGPPAPPPPPLPVFRLKNNSRNTEYQSKRSIANTKAQRKALLHEIRTGVPHLKKKSWRRRSTAKTPQPKAGMNSLLEALQRRRDSMAEGLSRGRLRERQFQQRFQRAVQLLREYMSRHDDLPEFLLRQQSDCHSQASTLSATLRNSGERCSDVRQRGLFEISDDDDDSLPKTHNRTFASHSTTGSKLKSTNTSPSSLFDSDIDDKDVASLFGAARKPTRNWLSESSESEFDFSGMSDSSDCEDDEEQ